MIVSHAERPRELKWYHTGALLYGDWGTSRLYVLGLAFYYALYSSFWYILAMGILVAAVGWAYTVVCRVYPDGGGVYSAARQISPVLSVIGALLLFANYSVTAALSALEGIHYFGIESPLWVTGAAIGAILFLGLINFIGPRHAGSFALLAALATLVLTAILVCFSVRYLPEGFERIKPVEGALGHRWSTLVNVVLALSGVEAIANMTGIMVEPVSRTSKKSIWPVLVEVVLFNLVLGVAMLALPAVLQHYGAASATDFVTPAADQLGKVSPIEEDVKNKVLRVMGTYFVHPWFGVACGAVFGLLLFSAVNTVIGGMISVCYVMARDTELPRVFSRLNLFGVPWVGLIPALAVPCVLLMMFSNLVELADLYAIGVVGAIAINLSCCTINKGLNVRMWERLSIGAIAAVMIAIELTLAVQKTHALVFVWIILAVGLAARFFTKIYLPARARMLAGPTAEQLHKGRYRGVEVSAPETVTEKPSLVEFGTPAELLDMSKPHIMVATRGGQRLLEFATSYAKQLDGILFVLYVRQFHVQFEMGAKAPTLEEDSQARAVFAAATRACEKAGVPMVPIYVVSRDVADSILDFAATYDVKALLMGVSREGALLRALRGDVMTAVADQLPQDIPLLIHA